MYATDGNAGDRTTVYAGSDASATPQSDRPGNGNGYIGPKQAGDVSGVIGGAAHSGRRECIAVLGLAMLCAILML